MDWHNLIVRAINGFEVVIIVYVLTINAIYFLLLVTGYFALRRCRDRLSSQEQQALLKSSLAPSVSVLAPAYNEAATIRESVRALLKLHYPRHEVIIINDGSTDATLEILIEEFHLYKSARAAGEALAAKPIRGIYESRNPIRLIVVDKENGGKADSLNAGLNVARSTLVAVVDSDSLLEEDALLYVVKPFLEDPERTLVSCGMVRVANGCQVRHGRVTRVGCPSSILARFQAVEYLRAFLGSRIAFSFLNSLLVVSGAFGLFRRQVVLEAGGFNTSTVGEDMELIVRLHRQWRKRKQDYRIVFVPEPVCWTEVPETREMLRRQRNRWHRGTIESLRLHKTMFLNPKYGLVGLFACPYFALFEILGPTVELTGYLLTIVGGLAGLVWKEIAILFFFASVGFGIFLSASAVVLEEMTTRRYPAMKDVGRLFWAAILENFGYRQLLTFWRTQGLLDGIRGKKGWGAMERRGFQSSRT